MRRASGWRVIHRGRIVRNVPDFEMIGPIGGLGTARELPHAHAHTHAARHVVRQACFHAAVYVYAPGVGEDACVAVAARHFLARQRRVRAFQQQRKRARVAPACMCIRANI